MHVASIPDDRLQENLAAYQQIMHVARRYARLGNAEMVLRSATVAAHLAWKAPIGALADPELETLVRDAVAPQGGARIEHRDPDGRVLHVLSEGYAVGGHTRLAWRWMQRDHRPADVVLTMQYGPVPAPLLAAARRAGGRVFDLREAFPDLLARAEALRGLMDRASTVVYHVHPYDAVALAAAGFPGPRPPIVYENHADHTFWLGAGCADVVAENRDTGLRLSHELRGLPAGRLRVLPLPIDPPAPVVTTRESVREALGVRPDQVVAVSVATAMKMAPIWGEGFDALLERVLTRIPELVVVLVGPSADGAWADLRARFPGRVIPLGVVDGVEDLYPGMDLYLDSYPCSSSTSILEAAATGLPPLSLLLHRGIAEIFNANSPGLADTGYACSTEDEYVGELRALVQDPELRRKRGELARSVVLSRHAGPAWDDALEDLYRTAHGVDAADPDALPGPVWDDEYGNRLLPFTLGQGRAPAVAAFAGALGPQMDDQLRIDLLVAANVGREPRLSVRAGQGWEDHPAWTMALTHLARRYPWLSVSFPLAAGDDGSGAESVRALEPVLAAGGMSTSDCGDLSIDPEPPAATGPSLGGELSLTSDGIEALELILRSPMWDPAVRR